MTAAATTTARPFAPWASPPQLPATGAGTTCCGVFPAGLLVTGDAIASGRGLPGTGSG